MINFSIDLSKIDKTRIKEGKDGAKYYKLTVDKKQSPDKFGNDHTVYDTPTKDERTAKKPKTYLGSGKEFVFNGQTHNPSTAAPTPPAQNNEPVDDLPF